MEPRYIPDIAGSLEWDLVLRSEYQATENGNGTYTPISPITQIISGSHTLMIGVKSSMSLQSWYTGGWASQRLLLVPSSLSEFTANVQTSNFRLRLGVLNLCTFPKHQETWMLYLKIPKWLKQATVEIWRYDGVDKTVFDRVPLDWQFVTLSGWQNNGAPFADASYAITAGIVRIRGNIRSLGVNPLIFTLPEGYRPAAELWFSVTTKDANGFVMAGSVLIKPDGSVAYGGYGYGDYFSLDGIAFEAGDGG